MPILDAIALRKIVADRTLFEEVTLTIRRGEKVGLVGNNGAGKSTLGRVLAGLEESDGGTISRRRHSTVDYLAQEPRFAPGRTIHEVVLERLTGWNETKRRYEVLTEALCEAADFDEQTRLADQQALVGEEIERQGGWDREYEAEATISHLGLGDPLRCIENLSGGEVRRVALARLLVGEPDLAILDEPTNHLDIETIEWLEEFLRDRWKGALLVISHDRAVLEAVTTRTLEIHDGTVDAYEGGYGRYLMAKAEREAHVARTEQNRQNFLRREVEWLRRAPKARGTKQKARTARAEAALAIDAPQQDRQADLRFQSTRLGKTILETSDLIVERDGRRLIDGLQLALRPGERIGIIGPNGSGKTSLLLALMRELPVLSGSIKVGSNTKIGTLDQLRSGLDDSMTLREAAVGDASEVVIGSEQLTVGRYLERFLFRRSQQQLRVSELSGGERARVCLAKLLSQKCNLLLLDEPTNDLDVATLSALESMLIDFGGSVILVSHDRWMLDRVATSILAFEEDGRLELHVGGYSDYRSRRHRLASSRAHDKPKGGPSTSGAGPAARSAPGRSEAGTRRLNAAELRELESLIEAIQKAEDRVVKIQATLADPGLYQGDSESASAVRLDLEQAESEAVRLNARWEELEESKTAGVA
jgi:ATP-binding cassette subfamily F protein uup